MNMITLSKERIEKRVSLIKFLLENYPQESEVPEGQSPFQYEGFQHGGYTGQECDFEIMQEFKRLNFFGYFSFDAVPLPFGNNIPSSDVLVQFTIPSKERLREHLLQLEERIKPIKSLIRVNTLRVISKWLTARNTTNSLRLFLRDCGVDESQMKYPLGSHGVFPVLESLILSGRQSDHKILFTILEEACHPIMHGGKPDIAKIFATDLKAILKYDNLEVDDKNVIWMQANENGDLWVNKDGDPLETTSSNIAEAQRDNYNSIEKVDGDLRRSKCFGDIILYSETLDGKVGAESFTFQTSSSDYQKAIIALDVLISDENEAILYSTQKEFGKKYSEMRKPRLKKVRKIKSEKNGTMVLSKTRKFLKGMKSKCTISTDEPVIIIAD